RPSRTSASPMSNSASLGKRSNTEQHLVTKQLLRQPGRLRHCAQTSKRHWWSEPFKVCLVYFLCEKASDIWVALRASSEAVDGRNCCAMAQNGPGLSVSPTLGPSVRAARPSGEEGQARPASFGRTASPLELK
ncbi:hypothetical protein PCANC_23833, partial [Puccinia coronata f. sp. avenae]